MARVLLAGLRDSGKTSIAHVVCAGETPHSTMLLEATFECQRHRLDLLPLLQMEVVDPPGGCALDSLLDKTTAALVYVWDVQAAASRERALEYCARAVQCAVHANPRVQVHVLWHKTDRSEPSCTEEGDEPGGASAQDVMQSQLLTALDPVHPTFHITSVFDESILEAFSAVARGLVAHAKQYETLLATLVSSSGLERALLIDPTSKLCLAADGQAIDAMEPLYRSALECAMDMCLLYSLSGALEECSQTLTLANGDTLCLRQVHNRFVLMFWARPNIVKSRTPLIESNVQTFCDSFVRLAKRM